MDLISLPVEIDKKQIYSRYSLVLAVSKRARLLCQGAMPKVASKSKKMTTVALEETISGAVRILSGEAAVKAQEEAKKLSFENMMDEAKQKETIPDDLTEIEKDLKIYLQDKEEMESKQTIEDIFPEKGSL